MLPVEFFQKRTSERWKMSQQTLKLTHLQPLRRAAKRTLCPSLRQTATNKKHTQGCHTCFSRSIHAFMNFYHALFMLFCYTVVGKLSSLCLLVRNGALNPVHITKYCARCYHRKLTHHMCIYIACQFDRLGEWLNRFVGLPISTQL